MENMESVRWDWHQRGRALAILTARIRLEANDCTSDCVVAISVEGPVEKEAHLNLAETERLIEYLKAIKKELKKRGRK